MRIKAAGLVPVGDLAGNDMTRAETVTLFNDLCIMAPGALVDPVISWEAVETQSVRATFTNGCHSSRAELQFNDAGELIDFWSDDRLAASADGKTLTPMRWSTPVTQYRAFGPHRLASAGQGVWHPSDGANVYLELVLEDVQYNAGPR